MLGNEFDTAHAKIQRAGQHSAAMAEVWNDYLAPHPFDFTLERIDSSQFLLRIRQTDPIPLAMSVLFGEWLFNMRSALDALIWATAVHVSRQDPPPGQDQLQYPIFENEASWNSNLRRLRPLAQHQRDMLLSMQPFSTADPDANYLGWISRLARIDRHRRLTVSTARVAEAEPVFGVHDGESLTLEWGEFVLQDGWADLARVTFDSPTTGSRSFNPRIGIDPEILEWSTSPFWCKFRFSERLQMMQIFLQLEAAVYEYDCTGRTERGDMLSDFFRKESDARRAANPVGPVARTARRPIQWQADGHGRPSTAERLKGTDFQQHGSSKISL